MTAANNRWRGFVTCAQIEIIIELAKEFNVDHRELLDFKFDIDKE